MILANILIKKLATGPIQNMAINVPTPNVPFNKIPITNKPASNTGLTILYVLIAEILLVNVPVHISCIVIG